MPSATLLPLVIASSAALLSSVLALWAGRFAWIAALVATVVLGYAAGILYGPALSWIALLAAVAWLYRRWRPPLAPAASHALRVVLALGIVLLALLLAAHALPGFRNPILAQELRFSPGAAPYAQYLNFDKTFAGLLILGIVYQGLLRHWNEWREALRRATPVLVANIAVVVVLALAMGYVRFDAKWTAYFWPWAAVNLLCTCLSEEALFRGFIQRELAVALRGRYHGDALAVLVSAVLFGLAHMAGGWSYVFLSTVAGLGYAVVFRVTGRIEMSILAHFLLNATHFLLLTYPRAA